MAFQAIFLTSDIAHNQNTSGMFKPMFEAMAT
jgi:hypothetical protein